MGAKPSSYRGKIRKTNLVNRSMRRGFKSNLRYYVQAELEDQDMDRLESYNAYLDACGFDDSEWEQETIDELRTNPNQEHHSFFWTDYENFDLLDDVLKEMSPNE